MFSLKKEEVNVGRQRELDLVKGFLMIMIILIHSFQTIGNLDTVNSYAHEILFALFMPTGACLYLFAALPMGKGRMGACLFLSPEPEVDDTQMFDYSLFFINTLWDYYEATKDMETLQELWPVALRQIELAEEQLDEEMLVRDSDVLGWCLWIGI